MGLTITGGLQFGSGFSLIAPASGGGGPYWMSTLSSVSYWESASAVTTDSNNNIYLSGTGWGGSTQYDIFFGKLNTSAAIQLQKTFGTNNTDTSYGITVDSSGNIYLAGFITSGGTLQDFIVTKINSTGVIEWFRTIPDEQGVNDASYSIKVDSNGNVYASGVTYPAGSNKNVFIVKFNSTGDIQWRKVLSGVSEARSIQLDSSGNIYISGLANIGGVNKILVVKFSSSGNVTWQRSLGSANAAQSNGIAVDSSGNVYVCGYSGATLTAIVAKYDSSGSLLWQRLISGETNAGYTSIALDSNNNVYLTGYYITSGSTNALVVTKYDSSGNLQWKRFISSAATVYGSGITIDNTGDVVICGYVNNGTTNDILIVKLPNDGSKLGTYAVGLISLTYGDWTYTEGAANLTSSTSTLAVSDVTNTAYSGNYTTKSPNLISTVTQL